MSETEKMQATELSHEKTPETPTGIRNIIHSLESAKGDKFTVSAQDITRLQEQGGEKRFDGDICITCDNSDDQYCTFCDKPKDMCEKCDATDWDCGNNKDKCISCDEGDTCPPGADIR
ncbi:hypothetical protein INT08_04925 [Prosthecochloris sp. N3]|uniref:Uncharacterized protein n=1 Tax=Prosthecochloris ethylica TaxID=2743976 RepID=A0ABR9XRF2_9CHLB|nr:hypothetical protein [Prosthecochloris ethylica]MBF0586077.1 hypothetical protein [Prosthecochloris ethylica]MBF0636523.1 hypothetical protein [Prosthecochloris ethylica]NUK47155.1 hypothetical protein [Prosthecochloris ethylica]